MIGLDQKPLNSAQAIVNIICTALVFHITIYLGNG